jgi:hypothetical protein
MHHLLRPFQALRQEFDVLLQLGPTRDSMKVCTEAALPDATRGDMTCIRFPGWSQVTVVWCHEVRNTWRTNAHQIFAGVT